MQTLLSRLNAAALTSPTVLRRGLWGLVFTLIAVLGYTSAGTAAWLWGRYLDAQTPAPAASARAEESAVRQRKPITVFDPILTNNIFHARRSTVTVGTFTPSAGTASAAPLRITLSGVFVAGKAAFAFIVGPDGRTEQVYQPGDCVPRTSEEPGKECEPSQGKLSRVLADRIVVNFGGQPTVFMLEPNASEGAAPGRPAPGAPPTSAAAPAGQSASVRTGNTIEMHLPHAEVEKAFENFAEVVKQARVVPYSKDGVTIGFQIQNIVPGSVFQRIGLQNFDVIKGVNRESLTSADQALRLFTVFRNEKEVVLDVQRQNEAVKLSYVID